MDISKIIANFAPSKKKTNKLYKSMVNIEDALIKMQKDVYNYAYNLTKDYDNANDLLQETFYKVLTNKDKFADNNNFKGWVYTITRNLFINDYRKKTREGTMNDLTGDMLILNSKESELITAEGIYTIKEINNFINECIKGNNRDIFIMFIEGYKYVEIAERFNLPLGTIKSKIFGVRRTLQKHFKEYQFNVC